MQDQASQLLQNIFKFLLSLLLPGGGQLFYGRWLLGISIYAIVVAALALVTRGLVESGWVRAALLVLAGLVYLIGAIEAWRVFYGTLYWIDRPWHVVLIGWVVLLGILLWLAIPRSASTSSFWPVPLDSRTPEAPGDAPTA